MKNSKKGNAFRMLSPQEYIRTKSRTLPLYQCFVNSAWEVSRLANILVARRHPNGNITTCIYLVDLLCQGVKDTLWYFNKSVLEYKEILQKMRVQLEIKQVNYVVIHNIIFAALEFAEEYDFHPHKDFTSVSRFMLEEDTDQIEILDIECGINGKPAYIRTPAHSKNETQSIISKLERNPGPGNYIIVG
ncbi:MAG TPA: hypothetical protein PLB27_13620 [Bacteroidales bacterium]|nr:hypothetical protein [Bacteroidales bacterium]